MTKVLAVSTVFAALVAALAFPAHGAPALSPGCTEANDPQYDGDYSVGTIGGFSPGEVLTITATGAVNETNSFHVQDLSGAGPNLARGEIPGTVVYTIPTTGQLIRWGIVVGFASWVVSCTAPTPPPPPPSLEGALADLEEMLADNPGTPLADKVEDAAVQVAAALRELAEPTPDLTAALGKLEGAAGDLEAMVADELVTEEEGEALLEPVVASARQLATDAIADPAGGDPDELAEASAALAEGDALRDDGRSKDAAAKYKDAYAKAVGA